MIRTLILITAGAAVGMILGALITACVAGRQLPEPAGISPLGDVVQLGSRDDHLAEAFVDALRDEDIEKIRQMSKLTTEIEILLYENHGEILRSLFVARPMLEFYGSIDLGERERRSIWKVFEAESDNEALLSIWIHDDRIRYFRVER